MHTANAEHADNVNSKTRGSYLGLAIVQNLMMAYEDNLDCYINEQGDSGIKWYSLVRPSVLQVLPWRMI